MNITPLSLCVCANDASFRCFLFNDVPSVPIGFQTSIRARRLARKLWPRIVASSSFKRTCKEKKYRDWECVVHAALRAVWEGGCIRYGRNRTQTTQAMQQVIRCAVEANLLFEVTSKPGGAHFSRLLVVDESLREVPADLRELLVNREQYPLVEMRSPKTDVPLPFDPDHPVASASVRKLKLVNAVNSGHNMVFQRYDPVTRNFIGERTLRSLTYRLFHRNWWHGRLYTRGLDGHTNLRRVERKTIRIDGQECVELDYSAAHSRLIYHLVGNPYPDDPYKLWGNDTTPELRNLAKSVVNISINAKSRPISACWSALSLRKNGKWKTGKDREDAIALRNALNESGMPLAEVCDRALQFHAPIARYFGSGMGAELMRLDSEIALDVLYELAVSGIPALGVHDSFIVPQSAEKALRHAMDGCYSQRLGFMPVVK